MLQPTTKRSPASLRMLGRTLVLALALLAYLAASAAAEVTWQSTFGSSGTTGGKFNRATGIAINNETENVYVADRQNNRIEEFDAEGNFIQTWGFDVVSSGPDDEAPANEQQALPIAATGGTFILSFEGQPTEPIAYNASAATVEEELEELASIGAGNVSVSGGPGDATASSPYIVEFVSAKGGTDLEQITIQTQGLGVAVGETLTCAAEAEQNFYTFANSIDYRWLANGTPISGATSNEYTVAPGDAGKALQCLAKAHWSALGSGTADNTYNLYTVASPLPGTAIPLGPSSLGDITGETLNTGTQGQTLTCNAGVWSGSPTSYTYRWYKNGTQLASHNTSGTTDQYQVTGADLSEPAFFQCSATAENAGGASTVYSALRATQPAPFPGVIPSVQVSTTTRGLTPRNGGPVLEVCIQAEGDTCKGGVKGPGAGQFAEPRGVAVDNSAGGEGAIYVQDDNNFRIQKFSAALEPLLTFGKEVNKTTFGKVCVFASGDICGIGVKDYRQTPGVFGGWEVDTSQNGETGQFGNGVTVDSDGNVYVATQTEQNPPEPIAPHQRVQKFSPSGAFLGQALVPTLVNARPHPISVAVDSTGRAYNSIGGELAAVQIYEPADFTLTGEGTDILNKIWPNFDPKQLAIDPRANQLDRVLIGDNNSNSNDCKVQHESFEGPFKAIVEFDNERHQIDCTVPEGPGRLERISGLAVSPNGNVYASDWENNRVKIYKLPTPSEPTIGGTFVSNITQQTASVHVEVEPGFETTTLTLELGSETCPGPSCSVQATKQAYGLHFRDEVIKAEDLEAGTKYHYRVVAENSLGEGEFADGTFTTYEFVDLVNDNCSNALARKQTRSIGLLDCRGYELASARSTGGYDVTSDLVPNRTPYDGRPDAAGKLLYSVVDGGIAGTGQPTNRGPDPYVATRTSEAGQFGEDKGTWTTKYMGIPADNPFASSPFSSTLGGTDSALGAFAFSGLEICSPCFAGELAGGIPVRLPNGELVQGMVGSEPVFGPEPVAGSVRKLLSGDGSHFVFGSEQRFEPLGHNEDGNVTIYERDLNLPPGAGTEVVSTDEAGEALSGEVGELDVSSNGSRVVVGTEVSSVGGNTYWHLYLHLSGQAESVALTEEATTGVLFDGMTADGSRVFFTTTDSLDTEDTDGSADVYEAKVDGSGNLELRLVSVHEDGSASNDIPACTPTAEWNTVSGGPNCSAVGFAGGSGLASGDGTFYFLSPEVLDEGEEAEQDEVNLYVVPPDANPEFVATIGETEAVENAVSQNGVHRYGDFQVSPNGSFAIFATREPLAESYNNQNHLEVYRFDRTEPITPLDCVSCNQTEAAAQADSSLPAHGLGLLNDGRVFFNSYGQLVLRDQNGRQDGYEWENGKVRLISTGVSPYDSGLLSASRDGKDAFFFTREQIVVEDENELAMRVYDARELGGVFIVPSSPPCAASDECHGPGTVAAPPPQIGTYEGTGGQVVTRKQRRCRKGFRRRKVRGKTRCVPRRRHHKRRRRPRRHGARLGTGGNR